MLFSFYNFISFSVHFWCWLKGPLSPRADNLCFMAVSVIASSWSRVQKYTHINIWTEKRKSDVGQGRNACISTNNATRGNLTLNQNQARSPCPCTTCPVVTSARIDSKEPGHSRSRDPGCPARGHTGSPRASLRCPLLGQDHSHHSLCAEQVSLLQGVKDLGGWNELLGPCIWAPNLMGVQRTCWSVAALPIFARGTSLVFHASELKMSAKWRSTQGRRAPRKQTCKQTEQLVGQHSCRWPPLSLTAGRHATTCVCTPAFPDLRENGPAGHMAARSAGTMGIQKRSF